MYKLVARCPKTRRQYKKWVYPTKTKFEKYSPDIIKRYTNLNWRSGVGYDIEVYELGEDESYQLIAHHNGIIKEIK